MLLKISAMAAVVTSMSLAGCASTATSTPEYQLKQIAQGGSRTSTVLVRKDQGQPTEQAYALTGRPERARTKAPTIPSHPKGTHGP